MRKAERAGWLVRVFLVALLVSTSCKPVKEDRSSCPCTLSVVLEGLPEYPAWVYVNGEWSGTARADTTLSVWVERGPEARVAVFTGAPPGDDGLIRVPYGSPCPPLYAFIGQADCSGESGSITVQVHRQFSTLHLELEGPGSWGKPYWAEVRGCAAGLDPWRGAPLPGDFHCRLAGDYTDRLPRQRPGDPLWLDIAMADGVIRSFPLGEYLLDAGYDWEAPDLKDIHLSVNLSISEIRLAWDLWSTTVLLSKMI